MIKQTLFTFFTLIACTSLFAESAAEFRTDKHFEQIKSNPKRLEAFLYQMPKGGDLHNHESGSSFPENLLRYAKNDSLCINRETFTTYTGSCSAEDLLNNADADANFYHAIVDAWSLHEFVPGKESGHDHFFATFGKFDALVRNHRGEILAEIANRAGKQNNLYLELMVTADNNASGELGKSLGYHPDFAVMRDKLLSAPTFPSIVASVSSNITIDEQKKNKVLACDTKHAKKGCEVTIRYLYQVLREQAPEAVFAQLLTGFEAAGKDSRVVGINMVQPEDGTISMQDYKLHMQMVSFLHKLYPNVRISLHAGELTKALVTPEGLTFHINDAVKVAGASRIGHGVDIANENNYPVLLQDMADKRVMVEINLSSNAGILEVKGKQHPLPLYMQYGVPVALSTDDQGITLADLTTQYVLAAQEFELSYATLKNFSRNSMTYSFLPGKSLWQDAAYKQVVTECAVDTLGSSTLSKACSAFLRQNEKARTQWKLERHFNKFESRF